MTLASCENEEDLNAFKDANVANLVCNDEYNHESCNFDGGDCCLDCIVTDFCSECLCHQNITGIGLLNPLIGNGICNDKLNNLRCSFDFGDCCPYPNLMGDGFCNDEANSAMCNYDGGDCCLSNLRTNLCTKCVCFASGVITLPGFPQPYQHNEFIRNGVDFNLSHFLGFQIVFVTYSCPKFYSAVF